MIPPQSATSHIFPTMMGRLSWPWPLLCCEDIDNIRGSVFLRIHHAMNAWSNYLLYEQITGWQDMNTWWLKVIVFIWFSKLPLLISTCQKERLQFAKHAVFELTSEAHHINEWFPITRTGANIIKQSNMVLFFDLRWYVSIFNIPLLWQGVDFWATNLLFIYSLRQINSSVILQMRRIDHRILRRVTVA